MQGGGFDEDLDFENDNWPQPVMNKPIRPLMPPRRGGGAGGMPNNDRYNNAYGNYRGGYGPGGGFGPPPPPMGPPMRPLMGPPMCPPMGPPMGPRRPRGPAPHGPMIMFGRGFGPGAPPGPVPRNMPPQNRASRYLQRCGVPLESIKNLPKKILILMEAHHCGVCGMDLDSFAMSRIHYTSRNHAKNQTKWISQNAAKPAAGKEIPLKARELYCELCDVHITSTSHAESHYAGKPHRAIVEGRKKPKNPYLLQKGMETRTVALIRREKKHLPAMEAPKKDEAAEKTPQPELYCDICKTSMTCSEQMTMHLNGKRHLAKEKQHIIRFMMTGQQIAANGNGGQEEAPAATPTATPTAAPTEEQTASNDDGDWGNGSGTWEDT